MMDRLGGRTSRRASASKSWTLSQMNSQSGGGVAGGGVEQEKEEGERGGGKGRGEGGEEERREVLAPQPVTDTRASALLREPDLGL